MFEPIYYTTKSGVNRVKVYHPTKGFRDRSVDSLSMKATGLKADEVKLVKVEHV